jgi:predicted SnoaL-like aldol condensation-catalyzing enzyme
MNDIQEAAEKVFSVWNGDVAGYDAMAEDCVLHDASQPAPAQGRAAVRELVSRYRGAFPEMKVQAQQSIVVGDLVVTVWTAEGLGDRSSQGASIGRFRSGKIVESWIVAAES